MLRITVFALANLMTTLASAESLQTGTGFSVTFDGVVITNQHVVEGCSRLRAKSQGANTSFYETSIVAQDANTDLAAVKLEYQVTPTGRRKVVNVPRAIFRQAPPLRLGDQAITYGFPMQGILASAGNLTVGNVTALRGLRDSSNYIQISTPVQPGNSGGALLDGSGNVVGVVAAKLNAAAIMRATGDVPQNVNFAISIDIVRLFLAKNKIAIVEDASLEDRPLNDVALRAQLFTYLLECERKVVQ